MNDKTIIKVGCILIFILGAGLFYRHITKESDSAVLLTKEEDSPTAVRLTQEGESEGTKEGELLDDVMIYVHVCGAVTNPGVYIVKENTRLVDVILLAGGFREEAQPDSINQASIAMDGQQIYIPSKDEVLTIQSTHTEYSGKININKAGIEELMTLPGIGKAKAESILKYRTDHGFFSSIEDIMNIQGIKESVFGKISDLIDIK